MTPVEAKYFLNGEEKEKIAAKDGQSIALETPAGIARAHLRPRRSGFLGSTLGERFQTQFPGQQRPYREFISIFEIKGYKEKRNMPTLIRKKTYIVNEGELKIELKAINTDLSELKKK